jgi:hypothetical protein
MIDGVLKTWGTELVGYDIGKIRQLVEESRDYVLGAAKFEHNVLEQKHGLSKHHACAPTIQKATDG